MKTRKLVLLGLLDAIALTLFMIEAQIPALVPIPGIKLGLSNIITVFTVFAMGPMEGAAVLFEGAMPRAAAPGQAAVFYLGDEVIGGGTILPA